MTAPAPSGRSAGSGSPAGTGTGEPLREQVETKLADARCGHWEPADRPCDDCRVFVRQSAAAVMAVVQPALDAKDAEWDAMADSLADYQEMWQKAERGALDAQKEAERWQHECEQLADLNRDGVNDFTEIRRELDAANRALEREATTAREAVRALAAVRELHREAGDETLEGSWCLLCTVPFPCPTFLAASPNPERGTE